MIENGASQAAAGIPVWIATALTDGEAPAPGRHREEREARRGDPEGDGRRPMIPGLLRFARNDGGSDARDLHPSAALLAHNGVGLEDRRRAGPDAEVDRARRQSLEIRDQ